MHVLLIYTHIHIRKVKSESAGVTQNIKLMLRGLSHIVRKLMKNGFDEIKYSWIALQK